MNQTGVLFWGTPSSTIFCFVKQLSSMVNLEDFQQDLREYQQLEPQWECDVLVQRSNILNTIVEEF